MLLYVLISVHVSSPVVPAGDMKSVSVMEGDSVTLNTDVTEIQTDEVIQWKFEHHHSPVAEINRKTGTISVYDGPDERFRDRLKLDHQTGSLTITNTRTTDSGLYEAEISRSGKHTIHKSCTLSVSGEFITSLNLIMNLFRSALCE